MIESAKEAQRRFATENDAIADRLADAGYADLAAVYRDTAHERADCAGRLAGATRR